MFPQARLTLSSYWFILKKNTDFQNAVILQPLDDFLCPIRKWKLEMRAFHFWCLNHKVNTVSKLFWHDWIILTWIIFSTKYYVRINHKCSCQHKSKVWLTFYGLDTRNGTYASLAFISGVGHKNSSGGCKIIAFWKSVKKLVFKKKCRTP